MVTETWAEPSPGRTMMLTTSVRGAILFMFIATAPAAGWTGTATRVPQAVILSADASEFALPEALERLWSLFRRVKAKDGCHIDPDGRCTAAQIPESRRKDGCHIDPFGRCIP